MSPGKTSQELLADAIAARRADAKAQAGQSWYSDADLARVQAEASARAATPAPTSGVSELKLPAAARLALAPGRRVDHPRILLGDVRKFLPRRFDVKAWFVGLNRSATRVAGMWPSVYLRVIGTIRSFDEDRRGKAQAAMIRIAARAQVCIETVRRAVRHAEDLGVLLTCNVLVRRKDLVARAGQQFHRAGHENDQLRDANLYVFRVPADEEIETPAPAEAPAAALDPLVRRHQWLAELLPLFGGMFAREQGLNTSPARSRRPPDDDPLPSPA